MTMFGGALGCFVALVCVCGVGGFLFNKMGKVVEKAKQQQVEVNDEKDSKGSTGKDESAGEKKTSVEAVWSSPDKTVQLGDVRVRILGAAVGKISLVDVGRDRSTSKDDLLMITVELSNRSATKKLEYDSWSGADVAFRRDYATIRDNFDNNYKRITFGLFSHPVGAAGRHESLFPGKSVSDVLVFEPPIDRAAYLNLEMPAKNFGEEGMIRFRLPVKDIPKTKD